MANGNEAKIQNARKFLEGLKTGGGAPLPGPRGRVEQTPVRPSEGEVVQGNLPSTPPNILDIVGEPRLNIQGGIQSEDQLIPSVPFQANEAKSQNAKKFLDFATASPEQISRLIEQAFVGFERETREEAQTEVRSELERLFLKPDKTPEDWHRIFELQEEVGQEQEGGLDGGDGGDGGGGDDDEEERPIFDPDDLDTFPTNPSEASQILSSPPPPGVSQFYIDEQGQVRNELGNLATKENASFYRAYITRVEVAEDIIENQQNLDAQKALSEFNAGLKREAAELSQQFTAAQNERDRALEEDRLEESIRANREAERLNQQRLELQQKEQRFNILLSLAANPAIFHSLNRMGVTAQIAKGLGINPAALQKIGQPADGGGDPLSAFNIQDLANMTPQQRRQVMFSLQAQTGLSEPEIIAELQRRGPGTPQPSVRRQTLG